MSGPVLLYDGECGFCDGTVKFVLRHDSGGVLRFAALQSAFGQEVRGRHPELADVDSIVWLDSSDGTERVAVRSEAGLRLTSYLGGVWRLARVARLIPRVLRDAAYDLFARHRYRLFGRSDQCELPSLAERQRFMA